MRRRHLGERGANGDLAVSDRDGELLERLMDRRFLRRNVGRDRRRRRSRIGGRGGLLRDRRRRATNHRGLRL